MSTEPLDFVFQVNQLLQKPGVDVNISSSLDMFQCVLGSPVLTQHQESHDASGGARFAEHAVHVDLVGRARRQCLLNVRRDIFKISEIDYRGSSPCTNSTSTNSTSLIFQKDPYLFGLHEFPPLARTMYSYLAGK